MEEINKQQQFFLSEYHLQEINSREIYPHSTFSSKEINAPKFEKMQIHFQGSHRVLNSWKSLEICPAIFQTW